MLDFIVTGCGRSGTQYTSQLFTQVGIKCTHEAVFGSTAMRTGVPTAGHQQGPGEASWIAAGILTALPKPYGAGKLKVLHQVRNPVHVIRSMAGINSFVRQSAYRDFAHQRVKQIRRDDRPILACMKFWVLWNSRIDEIGGYDKVVYRVEDLAALPELLASLALFLDRTIDASHAKVVQAKLGTTVHSRSRDESVTWDSLPNNKWKERVLARALTYGYTLKELQEA